MSETPEETPEETQEPEAPETPTPDEEDEEQEEQETPAQAASREGSADIPKKLERALTDQRKRLEKIVGTSLEGKECPTCDGMGYMPEGTTETLELATADDAQPCEACNALGVVLTGSKNPDQATKPCAKCGGRGWHEKIVEAPPLAYLPAATPAEQQVLQGQWIPGKGFVPYGSEEAVPGSFVGAS